MYFSVSGSVHHGQQDGAHHRILLHYHSAPPGLLGESLIPDKSLNDGTQLPGGSVTLAMAHFPCRVMTSNDDVRIKLNYCLSRTNPLSLCLSLSRTNPLSLCLSLSRTNPLSQCLSLSRTNPLSQCLSLSRTNPLSLCLSLSKTNPLSQCLSLSRTNPLSQCLSLSRANPLSQCLSLVSLVQMDENLHYPGYGAHISFHNPSPG